MHYDRVGHSDDCRTAGCGYHHDDGDGPLEPVSVVLIVLITLFALLLGAAVAFYGYLRFFRRREDAWITDAQELTQTQGTDLVGIFAKFKNL